MALSKSIRILFVLLIGTASLVSCAKKDDAFAGRKNAAGAGLVGDASKNDRAIQNAAANGLAADIQAINNPVMNGQVAAITSQVVVNGFMYDVTTNHPQLNQIASVSGTVGNYTLQAQAICLTANCSPYYLMLNFSRGNQLVLQIMEKKFFVFAGAETSSDLVIYRQQAELVDMMTGIQILDAGVPDQAAP